MYGFLHALLACLLLLIPVVGQSQDLTNVVLAPHARELVALQGDKLSAFEPEQFLKAPYTILYFGAGWCPDCRRFSPQLVSAYNQQPAGRSKFEVLLLSKDKTEVDMMRFMRSEKMSWPALAFDKMERAGDLRRYYSGHGIPCLTIIDQQGKVILQSKNDQDAAQVLKQFQQLLAKTQ